MFGLGLGLTSLLIVCLLAACIFEFINGFHDTANAVATVIYTNSLKPQIAVIWSGFMNFVGVYVGGIAVAMGIVNLLPISALVDQNIYHSLSMILSLIFTAIIWNLGTWYYGIPCSSTHTLIGSIFGVGLAYSFLPGNTAVALNWLKVQDVGLSLLISPVIGFGLAMGLMVLLKKIIKSKKIFEEPSHKKPPPLWIRSLLILTCTSVSFSHGSNDGQKGIGLMMIILIGIVPGYFALNHQKTPEQLLMKVNSIHQFTNSLEKVSLSDEDKLNVQLINIKLDSLYSYLNGEKEFNHISKEKNFLIRKEILLVSKVATNILSKKIDNSEIRLSKEKRSYLQSEIKDLKGFTEYAIWWVILLISLSLGLGTMIGWKRIVVTVGEKIGKTPLTYAQGASAEIIAAITIASSSFIGLPVSTTHVLSSGVAGVMVEKNGFKNLRKKTVKNILIAWLVTIPVTIILSSGLFLLFRVIFK